MKNKIENQGIYETLVAQLDRVARHNRQGSIQTKRLVIMKRSNGFVPIWQMSIVCKSCPTSTESIWSTM